MYIPKTKPKEEIREMIDTSTIMTAEQKLLLQFLLDVELNYLTFNFGNFCTLEYSSFIYTEYKLLFVQDLINKEWTVEFAEIFLVETNLVAQIIFEEAQTHKLFSSDLIKEIDKKINFFEIDVYLEISEALEKKLITNTEGHLWGSLKWRY